MASRLINHKCSLDADYRLDNLNVLISAAKDLPYYYDSAVSMSDETAYSISHNKRSRLFCWVIELLDNFSHDCQNPNNCQYRCDSRCQSQCSIRCSDRCEKPRVLSSKTRQLTFLLIDIFLYRAKVKDTELQLLATAAFFLVTKIEESFCITLEDACLIGGNIYSLDEISYMELQILKVMKWKLSLPTPTEIASNSLLIFDLPSELDVDLLLKNIDSYIEFCLIESEISKFGMITISLSSILCAFQQMDAISFGEELVMALCQYFNLNKERIRDCVTLTSKIINDQAAVKKIESSKKCNEEEHFDNDRDNSGKKSMSMTSDKGIPRKSVSDDRMDIQDMSTTNSPDVNTCKEEKMDIINEKTEVSASQCDNYLECQSPCLELLQASCN